MSWLMAAWTLTTMWLMSERWYRTAWVSSLLSQFGWMWVAHQAKLPGMMALSICMVFIALRAQWKIFRESATP